MSNYDNCTVREQIITNNIIDLHSTPRNMVKNLEAK